MKKILLFIAASFFAMTGFSQNFWTPASEASLGAETFDKRVRPKEFKLYQLNEERLRQYLSNAPMESGTKISASAFFLDIPNADGKMEQYRIVEAPVMDKALAEKYPGIKSYAGREVNGQGTIRFDFTPLGFHAMLMSVDRPTIYIDPINKKASVYIVVSRRALPAPPAFECTTPETVSLGRSANSTYLAKNADDAMLRQYRIAVAASGEYSQAWLNGTEANDAARVAKVIAAINTNLMRVNGIMERDFNARFNLIGNNDLIVYLDASTDPFTTSNMWNNQAQTAIDGAIGSANYDIGHMVTEQGDFGNAGGIGTICNNGNKGSGYTSRGDWQSGIYFEEYILTHEMGHQCDANHTFTHDDEGTIAQVEPGSGTTIMSYAGITGPNTDVIPLMDDYFHAISIQQATDYLKATACASASATGNAVPSANAGSDFTIPKSTPFTLTGSGSDADAGDVLSFVWEQMDVATSFPHIPNTTDVSKPQFRSRPPVATTSRTFPILASILDGTNNNKWEVLSSVNNTLKFRFTVRDNNPGTGNNNSDDMVLTVDGSVGPLTVTSPNSNITWCPGAHTVTWDVNGTNALAANVNILLSTDGGMTFNTLVGNTPNDGSQGVNIGCAFSNTARIKVEAVGNIFFDISNTNFTIGDNTKPTFTVPADITILKDATCSYNASIGVTGDVTDEADNCDNTLDATPSDVISAGSCVGETIITRTWTLTDDCGNTTQKVQTITIKDETPPTFTAPPDITIYKDENCNHDASIGVTGDVTDEADNCDPTLDATFSDVTVPGSCIGEEIITRTWTLTDDCGNSTSHDQVITVKDILPPVISNASATPNTLWAPNHKMVDVTINYTAVDNCSPVTNSLSVASNQPINGKGDGNTSPDWQVVNSHAVMLRAERSGKIKTDRIYTITIKSVDDCGNVSTKDVYVTVPHDQSRPIVTSTEKMLEVLVLPNPSTSVFRLYIDGNNDEPVSIKIIDRLGRTVQTLKGDYSNSSVVIDRLPFSGVYFAEVIQGKERKVVRLVKQ